MVKEKSEKREILDKKLHRLRNKMRELLDKREKLKELGKHKKVKKITKRLIKLKHIVIRLKERKELKIKEIRKKEILNNQLLKKRAKPVPLKKSVIVGRKVIPAKKVVSVKKSGASRSPKKSRTVWILIFVALLLSLAFSVSLIYAQEARFNYCCEKTQKGAWCQNTLEESCDISVDPRTTKPYRKTPASCDATSFCKMGCCVDTEEGLCMENTPEKVCEISEGTWFDDSECNIPQCDLGCCILGDQASFVTLTRCKRLSMLYGLETNFQRNINDEATCIIQAHLQDKGACVFESEYMKTCKFTTRNECINFKGGNLTSEPEFHKDYLCSADELATDCGLTEETICVEGRDEVYFKDSCGNPANIYDSSKAKNPSYWKKIVSKSQSCGFNSEKGNAGSKTCGNCDYFRGSICSKGTATYGDKVCKDLNCYNTENGKNYKNGESWCVDQANIGKGRDVVGSRHFRHLCINGEEIIEPCADFRNEICIENIVPSADGGFIEAGCIVNRWKDCIEQNEIDDCLNTDQRDCHWKKGFYFESNIEEAEEVAEESGSKGIQIDKEEGVCLPNIPPGLKFWEGNDANTVCSLGNSKQVVIFEEGLFGGESCKQNCETLEPNWPKQLNQICVSLGDCGAYVNIAGKFTNKGVEWKQNGERKVLDGILDNIKSQAGV